MPHPQAHRHPARARAGDRFDLIVLGLAAVFLMARGSVTLDALSIQDLIGRTGTLIYLGILTAIGGAALVVRDNRSVGRLLLVAGAVTLTICATAVIVRGLEGALLPAAIYLIAGRRLAERAWYLEAGETR